MCAAHGVYRVNEDLPDVERIEKVITLHGFDIKSAKPSFYEFSG
jgi:hypothetical protein